MAYHNRFFSSHTLPIGAMLLGISASSLLADAADSSASIRAIDIQESVEIELPRYQSGISKTAKTGQLAHDVPQAITVVTKELLHDKSEFTLKEAMSNVAGLTFNAAEGGRIGDNMNLRGFYTFGDLYLDGIRDVAQYNRDTFNLESVDVLRGGAAMLFGRGQAGGVINQVSKDAEAENFGKLSVTAGTNDYKRASTDINVMLNDTTAFRLNAMGMDAGSTRDDVYNESYGVAPTVTFGLGSDNEFSLSHLYLNTHITPDYGVPFDSATKRPIDVDKSTYYGFTDDYEDNRVNITTASYTQVLQRYAAALGGPPRRLSARQLGDRAGRTRIRDDRSGDARIERERGQGKNRYMAERFHDLVRGAGDETRSPRRERIFARGAGAVGA